MDVRHSGVRRYPLPSGKVGWGQYDRLDTGLRRYDEVKFQCFIVATRSYCKLTSGSPRAQRSRLSRKMRTLRNSLPADAPALCGVMITFGISHNGDATGSGSVAY